VGRLKTDLPYVWLIGGGTTLLTTPFFGRLSDRFGKLHVFRVLAIATLIMALVMTNLPSVSLATTLLATTLFMVASSGRMVPAMALLTACTEPRCRGSFMSVNTAVQQMAAGVAPLLAGVLLGDTESGGPLTGFGTAGLVAAVAMVASVILAG